MLSRGTIIWFLLLCVFSVPFGYAGYLYGKPCRDWKATHPGVDPYAHEDGDPEVSFNACTVIE